MSKLADELSIKVDDKMSEAEITIPADGAKAVAMLAALIHNVAEMTDWEDDELLALLSTVMNGKEDE